jgi:AAA+ ATPase superfamily predicted ATPase
VNVPSTAHFISREAELSRLRDVIAGELRPRTVAISGDAGVGKTRLLREVPAGVDGRVLSGGCLDAQRLDERRVRQRVLGHVTEVFERAEGNAFCVEQLVAAAQERGGQKLPILLDVGKALFVTEKTTGAHVSSILAKLSFRSRVEAAAAAHRLGLVDA